VRWRDYVLCIPALTLALVFALERHLPSMLLGYWIVFLLFFCFWQFAFSVLALASTARLAPKGCSNRTKRYLVWMVVSGVGLALALFRAAEMKAILHGSTLPLGAGKICITVAHEGAFGPVEGEQVGALHRGL